MIMIPTTLRTQATNSDLLQWTQIDYKETEPTNLQLFSFLFEVIRLCIFRIRALLRYDDYARGWSPDQPNRTVVETPGKHRCKTHETLTELFSLK